MTRPRTIQGIEAEIVALIWERRSKCYIGGTPEGSCINQTEWDRIQKQIDKLHAEIKSLESATPVATE